MFHVIDIFEKNNIEYFFNFVQNKKIVFFGASDEAKRALNSHFNNLNISYFCDNNAAKWGKQFLGYDVKPPEALLNEDSEQLAVIISCRLTYFFDILRQVEDLNIKNCFYSFLFDSDNYKKYYKSRFTGEYFFEDRRKNYKKLLVIIAGYKEFLWDIVFKRISRFLNPGIDVCVVLPGVQNENMKSICKKNSWSYLSTEQNKLSLAQNIAIQLHQNAELIYKLDEDIFIGKDYFNNLETSYLEIKENALYKIGFVAPLIPVNGFGYIHFLNKIGVSQKYEDVFGRSISASDGIAVHNNPKAAEFLWKYSLPFDKVINRFSKEQSKYEICPHRFSIGAILFNRKIWEQMFGFEAGEEGQLGTDETQICQFCMDSSQVIFISTNTVAGHFSFGNQTDFMKQMYFKNKELFDIDENEYL